MKAIRQLLFGVLMGVTVLGVSGARANPTMTLDLGGGVNMEFVLIQPGTFMMGSTNGLANEMPVHQVTITKAFYLGKYPVTQEQFQQVVGSNPGTPKGATYPINNINIDGPINFCANLRALCGVSNRTPYEAEWEYACRAGTTSEYYFGNSQFVSGTNMLAQYAWYGTNSGSTTHPVGQLKPNAWGLYDMHGNVREWLASGEPMPYPATNCVDPLNRELTHHMGTRGGSFASTAAECRSASRDNYNPGAGSPMIGFRVLIVPPTNMLPAETAHGIPYTWLQSYGISNTSDSVETQRVAGSSLNVLQAYIAGICPTNPNSCFLVSITNLPGQIIVRVPSVQATGSDYNGKARYYDVELRTNLLIGSWQTVSGYTSILGNGSIVSCTNATQNQAAFYRAKVWLQ